MPISTSSRRAIPQAGLSVLFKANVQAVFVAAIYRDKFTYIRANPTELPTLYEPETAPQPRELPSPERRVHRIPRGVDRGELVAGKQKLVFGTTWK